MPVYIVFDWYKDEFLKSTQKKVVGVYTTEKNADAHVDALINKRYLDDREQVEESMEVIKRHGVVDPKTKKTSYHVPKVMTTRLERELGNVNNYTMWLKNVCELPYYEEHRLQK